MNESNLKPVKFTLDNPFADYTAAHPKPVETVMSDANLNKQIQEAADAAELARRQSNWRNIKRGAAVVGTAAAVTAVGVNNLMDEADFRDNSPAPAVGEAREGDQSQPLNQNPAEAEVTVQAQD